MNWAQELGSGIILGGGSNTGLIIGWGVTLGVGLGVGLSEIGRRHAGDGLIIDVGLVNKINRII